MNVRLRREVEVAAGGHCAPRQVVAFKGLSCVTTRSALRRCLVVTYEKKDRRGRLMKLESRKSVGEPADSGASTMATFLVADDWYGAFKQAPKGCKLRL